MTNIVCVSVCENIIRAVLFFFTHWTGVFLSNNQTKTNVLMGEIIRFNFLLNTLRELRGD